MDAVEREPMKLEIFLAAHETMTARRNAFDSLMWQVPALGLSAQAFLLTIALGHDTARVPRLLAAGLALVIAVISMQLMAKHRFHELLESKSLEDFERRFGPREFAALGLHRRPLDRAAAVGLEPTWWQRRRSYYWWIAGLGAFAVVALIVVAITAAGLEVF